MLANSSVHSSHGVPQHEDEAARAGRAARCGRSLIRLRRRRPSSPGRVATSSTRPTANSAATTTAPSDGNVAPTTMPATAGPTARWNTGRTTPSTPLAASSCSAGRIRGRMRAVGGEEERRRDAQRRRPRRPCARSAARQSNPSTATAETATTLTASTAMMIARWLIRSAAMPPTSTNADQAGAEARRDQRQRRGVVVELDDLQRHHDGPHALGEDRQRHGRDQQAVLAEPERCEHAPAGRRSPPAARCRIAYSRIDGRRPNPVARVERFSRRQLDGRRRELSRR